METAVESTTEHAAAMAAAIHHIDSEHWLASYINGLVQAFRQSNGIDFATAETLLAREKQTFEGELATARKIYRLYPHLVNELKASHHVERA